MLIVGRLIKWNSLCVRETLELARPPSWIIMERFSDSLKM